MKNRLRRIAAMCIACSAIACGGAGAMATARLRLPPEVLAKAVQRASAASATPFDIVQSKVIVQTVARGDANQLGPYDQRLGIPGGSTGADDPLVLQIPVNTTATIDVLVLWLQEDGLVHTFFGTQQVTIVAGLNNIDMTLDELPTGSYEGSVTQGGKQGAMPADGAVVRPVDAATGVLLVPATASVNQIFRGTAAWYECPSLAVGRAVNFLAGPSGTQATLDAGANLPVDGGAAEFDIALP